MKTIKLNNGIEIPLIGIGTNTFGKVDNLFFSDLNYDTKELEYAIRNGYRLIDTAIAYRNEKVIGKAVVESGLARSDFIITTKIPGRDGYIKEHEVRKAIEQSLTNLQTDYIDIVLIHHPWQNLEEILQVYQVLESFVESGQIKTIGVSNFKNNQLQYLLENAKIKPAINQIASYPGKWQDDLVTFGQDNGVVIQAWSPLKNVSDSQKEILNEIGKKYNKSWAQVILNYQVSRGVVVIPKSHNEIRQQENFDIFDFTLTKEENQVISNL